MKTSKVYFFHADTIYLVLMEISIYGVHAKAMKNVELKQKIVQ